MVSGYFPHELHFWTISLCAAVYKCWKNFRFQDKLCWSRCVRLSEWPRCQDVLSCCCQIVIRVVTRISTTTVSFSARRWGQRWRTRCRRGPWRWRWCWAVGRAACDGSLALTPDEADETEAGSDCADQPLWPLTYCCCYCCSCPRTRCCCCCCCWGCCCCCGTGRRCTRRRCRSSPPCRARGSRAPGVTLWELLWTGDVSTARAEWWLSYESAETRTLTRPLPGTAHSPWPPAWLSPVGHGWL